MKTEIQCGMFRVRTANQCIQDARIERERTSELLSLLIKQCSPFDFNKRIIDLAPPRKMNDDEIQAVIIKEIMQLAQDNNLYFRAHPDYNYVIYKGEWNTLPDDEVGRFLVEFAIKMGVKFTIAKDYRFANRLHKRFRFYTLVNSFEPKAADPFDLERIAVWRALQRKQREIGHDYIIERDKYSKKKAQETNCAVFFEEMDRRYLKRNEKEYEMLL